MKIFGSCTAMGGLIEQGYSPVQTAKNCKKESSEKLGLFWQLKDVVLITPKA